MTFYHTEQFTISKKTVASDDILTYKELHAVQENVSSNNILPYTAFQTIKKN